MGRFINADAFASTGQDILGQNRFAYCANNPTSRVDLSGYRHEAVGELGGGSVAFSTVGFVPNGYFMSGGSSIFTSIIDFLTNTDESIVINSNSISFYKGTLFIKVPGQKNSAFSFGAVFMQDSVKSNNLVRHEYGHTIQLNELGIPAYFSTVVFPSVTCFALTQNGYLPDSLYYSLPWEYKANEFGEATATYTSWAKPLSNAYWFYSKLVSVLF